MPGQSTIEYFGDSSGSRCGYCKSQDGSVSYGMWAHQMTTLDYQDLIDRGWRRSGQYCYKPDMKVTCCPLYPIRCDVTQFHLSKSHKKVLKRVNRYLNYGIKPIEQDVQDINASEDYVRKNEDVMLSKAPATNLEGLTNSSIDGISATMSTSGFNSSSSKGQSNVESVTQTSCDKQKELKKYPSCKDTPQPALGPDLSKPPCKKQKQLRKEKFLQKHGHVASESHKQFEAKSLEDFLTDSVDAPKHTLIFELIPSCPPSTKFQERFNECHEVYKRYQMIIHQDDESKPSVKQYSRFLVNSPLQREAGSHPDFVGYGSYHQHYILDGRVIAVGVLDILPYCVSSVYLYYDPDYAFLSLGTYSALREIALVRQLQTLQPELKYYYMGFYIHSCPKMRYKGQYYPSYLNCPESYTWVPIEDCRSKFDISKYCRLSQPGIVDKNSTINIDRVLVLWNRQPITYSKYKKHSHGIDEEEVKEYSSLVGMTCAKRMLLFRK